MKNLNIKRFANIIPIIILSHIPSWSNPNINCIHNGNHKNNICGKFNICIKSNAEFKECLELGDQYLQEDNLSLDDKIQIYLKMSSKALKFGLLHEAHQVSSSLYSFGVEVNNDKVLSYAHKFLGHTEKYKGNYESAKLHYQKASSFFKTSPYFKDESWYLMNQLHIVSMDLKLGNYNEAVSNYEKISEQIDQRKEEHYNTKQFLHLTILHYCGGADILNYNEDYKGALVELTKANSLLDFDSPILLKESVISRLAFIKSNLNDYWGARREIINYKKAVLNSSTEHKMDIQLLEDSDKNSNALMFSRLFNLFLLLAIFLMILNFKYNFTNKYFFALLDSIPSSKKFIPNFMLNLKFKEKDGFDENITRRSINHDIEVNFDQLENELLLSNLARQQSLEFLQNIKLGIRKIGHDKKAIDKNISKIILDIDNSIQFQNLWDKIYISINRIRPGFTKEIKDKFPDITETEIKYCILSKLNISTDDIASIMNIQKSSVNAAYYRLRKKANLEQLLAS